MNPYVSIPPAEVSRNCWPVLTATCHCEAVRIEIDGDLTTVTDCNCSICRRYCALWAYFSPARVAWDGASA